MSETPSIDYRCSRCGALHIYQLVPLGERPTEDEVSAIPHEIPSIDLRCSRCGNSQTYMLVPDSVLSNHRIGNGHAHSKAEAKDVTLGRQVGTAPYEDPTQGREIGHTVYSDPTRAH